MSDPAQAGRERAIRDWSAGQASLLIHGDPPPDRPQLSQKGLYVRVWDEPNSLAAIEHCRSYNHAIDALIEAHGLPEWAPVKRLPGREGVLRMLTLRTTAFCYFEPESVRETRLVRVVSSTWGTMPKVIRHDPDRSLLLLAGDISAGASRIDVLDVKEGRWMARYEFLRKHTPHMPWD